MIITAATSQSMQSQLTSPGSRTTAPDKLTSSAQQFESMLLGQWLADAESSFGSAPGGDDDQDAEGEQMKDFGVRQLASQFVADGGIGIARMVKEGLVKADGQGHDAGLSHDAAQVQSADSAVQAAQAEVAR